ncbi:holo-ACP synthase [Plectonema radiosum NIES-515]|uniref:Holo-[acyl-carrier-protein] synthase n=1 Tax=Plectonema radiosum NIES-515 TaxID=2986073 RepID=A0ABT3B5M3_9CYAN|nr:holo-ACP synthase [Plectonema radiosum]MCV3216656.1 holo-ACP synthase [Plectonema radiosum NIES-515]
MASTCIDTLTMPDTSNIIGYGMEIVATVEIATLIEQTQGNFTMQYFTASERSITKSGIQHFAGRFCAKKAIFKALGMELNQQICWWEMEVQRLPTGEPSVVLHGQCQQIANRLGITKWLLSITHVSDYAAASAIALL